MLQNSTRRRNELKEARRLQSTSPSRRRRTNIGQSPFMTSRLIRDRTPPPRIATTNVAYSHTQRGLSREMGFPTESQPFPRFRVKRRVEMSTRALFHMMALRVRPRIRLSRLTSQTAMHVRVPAAVFEGMSQVNKRGEHEVAT